MLAATGLGKIAPIAVDLRGALTLSSTRSRWSPPPHGGRRRARAAGRLSRRPHGAPQGPARRLRRHGGGGAAPGAGGHFWPLLGARLVEGIGYVAVVVAAPALIISMGGGPRRITALAVWGTYFPVGLALGLFLGGVLSAFLGWRTWLVVQACALLVAGAAAVLALGGRTPAAAEPAPAEAAPPPSGARYAACCGPSCCPWASPPPAAPSSPWCPLPHLSARGPPRAHVRGGHPHRGRLADRHRRRLPQRLAAAPRGAGAPAVHRRAAHAPGHGAGLPALGRDRPRRRRRGPRGTGQRTRRRRRVRDDPRRRRGPRRHRSRQRTPGPGRQPRLAARPAAGQLRGAGGRRLVGRGAHRARGLRPRDAPAARLGAARGRMSTAV
ncbi:MFS transporter [Streptomyces nogalater]